MRNSFSALVFCLLNFWMIMGSTTQAQTLPPPPSTTAAAPAPAAPAAPKKSPLKMLYSGDYDGARLGDNLNSTKAPGKDPDSASISHDMRVGYAVAKKNVIGVREIISQRLQPTNEDNPDTFTWSDVRVYGTWGSMIDTKDVEMNGVLDIVFPSSDASQKGGLIFKMNIKNNWVFKTEIRNWTFSILTVLSPVFYQNPTTKKNFGLVAVPSADVDVAANWSLHFEVDLDAKHMYSANFYDFDHAESDTAVVGLSYTVNAHIQLGPSLKFYLEDMSVTSANLGFNLTASL